MYEHTTKEFFSRQFDSTNYLNVEKLLLYDTFLLKIAYFYFNMMDFIFLIFQTRYFSTNLLVISWSYLKFNISHKIFIRK